MKHPIQPNNKVNLFDKFKSGLTFILTCVRLLRSVTKANQVNRTRVLIGYQLPTHVCQSFIRQIRFKKTDSKQILGFRTLTDIR